MDLCGVFCHIGLSYQNIYKMLDFWGEQVYYMSRYSGIVQSVEQRTVNGNINFPPHCDLSEKMRRNTLQLQTKSHTVLHCFYI